MDAFPLPPPVTASPAAVETSRWPLFLRVTGSLLAAWAPLAAQGVPEATVNPGSLVHVSPPPPKPQPASTRKMIERLHEVDRRNEGTAISDYFPQNAVKRYAARLAAAKTTDEVLRAKMPYALALLNTGQSEAALEQLDSFETLLAQAGYHLGSEGEARYLERRALTYLRIGEQENCLYNHNAESCLLPIQGGGVHVRTRGSRHAIEALDRLLAETPTPYAAWLLNIAYMTLGEYPDHVPVRWRIPPECFASACDIKRFPDVAGQLGLDVDDLSGGVVMDDFDHDGWLDLMASAWGIQGQTRFFHNNGDGSFSDLTEVAGLTGLVGGLNMIQGDYNNDGYVDVLILREGWLGPNGRFPNSLLRNNGDNTFTDVTEEAGLLSFHPTQTAAWFDFDGDGWLDLFIGNETVPDMGEVDPCELYRNNGDGTFTECAKADGVAVVDCIKDKKGSLKIVMKSMLVMVMLRSVLGKHPDASCVEQNAVAP